MLFTLLLIYSVLTTLTTVDSNAIVVAQQQNLVFNIGSGDDEEDESHSGGAEEDVMQTSIHSATENEQSEVKKKFNEMLFTKYKKDSIQKCAIKNDQVKNVIEELSKTIDRTSNYYNCFKSGQ